MDPATALHELLPVVTDSPEATRDLGQHIVRALGRPCVLALSGRLGAGKTQLVKGMADGLGLDGDAVSSPTFTVVHEYRGSGVTLLHVDAYRVDSAAEFAEMGIEDVLYRGAWCVIEWPGRLGALLPRDTLTIAIEHRGESRRRFTLPDPAR